MIRDDRILITVWLPNGVFVSKCLDEEPGIIFLMDPMPGAMEAVRPLEQSFCLAGCRGEPG